MGYNQVHAQKDRLVAELRRLMSIAGGKLLPANQLYQFDIPTLESKIEDLKEKASVRRFNTNYSYGRS